MFLANSDYRKEYGNTGPVLTWLNLESKEGVDDLYRVWSARKAKLISAPESKPWGLHEFTAADPDGNLLRVFYDFATAERVKDASQGDARDLRGPRRMMAPTFGGSLHLEEI